MIMIMFAAFFRTLVAGFYTILYQVFHLGMMDREDLRSSSTCFSANPVQPDTSNHMIEIVFVQTSICTVIAMVNATSKTVNNFFISDRKSTRLNSSHVAISYAVFCLKKKINSIHHRINKDLC